MDFICFITYIHGNNIYISGVYSYFPLISLPRSIAKVSFIGASSVRRLRPSLPGAIINPQKK